MGRKPVDKKRVNNPERKKEWLHTITPLYIKHGLKHFSMNEVSKQLGVSKATLYKHFSSREQILAEALDLKLSEIANFKDDLFDESLPYMERYFRSSKVFLTEIGGISTEFLADLKELYPALWEKVVFFRSYASSLLMRFYQLGSENGVFHDIDPSILVINDKLFFDAISDPDFLKENNISIQKAFRDYITLRLNGLVKNADAEIDLTNLDELMPK